MAVDTGRDPQPVGELAEIKRHFAMDVRAGLADLVGPVHPLDRLVEKKRDEDANHHDADFVEELTPAMKRLGQINRHATRPQQ
jgi:hypothetical protein